MRIAKHGGQCCGITHISEFGMYPTDESIKALDKRLTKYNQTPRYQQYTCRTRRGPNFNVALECVLTDQQLKGKKRESWQTPGTGATWQEELEKRGFKQVFRFKNDNSGNFCNVFYYTPSGE